MAKVASALVDQGLVERVRNPDDRRSYALTRTPEGAAAARRWRRHAEDLEEALTAGFTEAEREELRGLLLRVAAQGLSPETPDALRESIAFLITRIHGWNHAELMAALRDLGIEPRHTGSLVALPATGPIAQAELARSLGISGASVVEIVDHSSGGGWSSGGVSRPTAHPGAARPAGRGGGGHGGAATGHGRHRPDPRRAGTPTERQRLVTLLQRFITGG